MLRIHPLLFLGGLAVSSLTAAEGYRFPTGKPILYRYDLDQEVAMSTAGDHLQFTSRISWIMSLEGLAQEATAGGLTPVRLAIQAVTAQHQAPGLTRFYDSATNTDSRGTDPLLSGLQALVGATLTLYLDPTTGRIPRVTGGERIAAAFARLHPNPADPGAPSPLASAARTVYQDDALARLWTGILLLPSPDRQAVPAGAPLTGFLVRSWQGTTWTGALDPAKQQLTLDLPPMAVTGQIENCTAQGSLTLADGVPAQGQGTLGYSLALIAMTQPVNQQHRLTWRLQRQP